MQPDFDWFEWFLLLFLNKCSSKASLRNKHKCAEVTCYYSSVILPSPSMLNVVYVSLRRHPLRFNEITLSHSLVCICILNCHTEPNIWTDTKTLFLRKPFWFTRPLACLWVLFVWSISMTCLFCSVSSPCHSLPFFPFQHSRFLPFGLFLSVSVCG